MIPFPPNVLQGTRGSDIPVAKELGGWRSRGARKVPRSSRLRFPDIFENVVQQYGTSAFRLSKTQRNIYKFGEND